MSRSLALIVGLLAVAASGYGLSHLDLGGLLAPEAQARTAPSEQFRLQATGSEQSCAVVRGREIGPGLAELDMGKNCDAVFPGVGKARFWQDRADGSVVFTQTGADAIVTFAAADGIAYESYLPALPVATMASMD